MPAPSPTTELGAFQLLAQGYIDKATEEGYSPEQIAILQGAQESGSISFENLKAAVAASLACVTDAGIYNELYPTDESRGFPMVSYFIEGPESGNAVADACIRENSEAVEALYQLQPSSVAAEEARFVAAIAEIAPCIEQAGVPFETDGMTTDEIWNKLLQISEEEGFPEDGSLGPIRTCMMNAGF